MTEKFPQPHNDNEGSREEEITQQEARIKETAGRLNGLLIEAEGRDDIDESEISSIDESTAEVSKNLEKYASLIGAVLVGGLTATGIAFIEGAAQQPTGSFKEFGENFLWGASGGYALVEAYQSLGRLKDWLDKRKKDKEN